MDNIIDKIRNIGLHIGAGLVGAEDAMFSKNEIDSNIAIVQEVGVNQLANALKQGVVTQEVADLRHRTYMISEEANKKETIIIEDGESFAITAQPTKPKIEEMEEGYSVVIVQNVKPIKAGIVDIIDNVNRIQEEYPLTIERDCISRHPIEKYCHLLVVKESIQNEEKGDLPNTYQLDLYFTVYADEIDRIARQFTNQIEQLYNKKPKLNDINDIQTLHFITNKAWGVENNREFKFEIESYIGCSKFNGYYILKYKAKSLSYNENILDKYFSDNIQKKYDNHERRPDAITASPLSVKLEPNHLYCDGCGKEMKGLEVNDYYLTKDDDRIRKGLCTSCFSTYLFENKDGK